MAKAQGVFSDSEILAAVKCGQILVSPFYASRVGTTSLDVTLGEWFYRMEGPDVSDAYNPFDQASVDRYFKGPFQAEPNHEWCARHGRLPWMGIKHDRPIVVLRPGERILAHTHEFVGIRHGGTSQLMARSTWGRNGLVVCKDAGWGDTGYINRWTMEIQNDNHVMMPLPVGCRVAQMVFHHAHGVERSYGTTNGRYQTSADLGYIQRTWRAQHMLPPAAGAD